MKILIIVALMFQLVTSLSADKSFNQYLNMKKKAYSFYENKRQKDAFWVVKDFINKHPKSIRAQNLLAVLYYWSGDTSKSKKILEEILKKKEFAQARSLLTRIEKKEGKNIKQPLKVSQKKVAKKSVVVDNDSNVSTSTSTSNLLYLVEKIKKDPNDALSRKILALHYEKIGNSKQASYFANSVLQIDPDDNEMIALLKGKDVSPYNSKRTVQRALKRLDEMFEQKSYNRFMNLYSSLENNNVLMPTQTHVNALRCAIELKDYEKAKSILLIYRMPKSKYIAEIEELLDEKLMLSRFAKDDCSSGFCKVRR